jgi:hypothetical protein
VRFQELQRNGAVEFGVACFIDDTHSAFAEFIENFVMGYRSANYRPSWKWLPK